MGQTLLGTDNSTKGKKVETTIHHTKQPQLSVRVSGSQSHQCVGENNIKQETGISEHAPSPPQGGARARWDKDIPTGQSFP